MQKFLVVIFVSFLVFFVICESKGKENRKPIKHFDRNDRQTNFCQNQTAAENSLTKIRQTIATLQSNESFNEVLQKRSNEINFLLSDENAALLSTNCTEFSVGLSEAKKLDRQAEAKLKKLAKTVEKLFADVFRSDDDAESSEEI